METLNKVISKKYWGGCDDALCTDLWCPEGTFSNVLSKMNSSKHSERLGEFTFSSI